MGAEGLRLISGFLMASALQVISNSSVLIADVVAVGDLLISAGGLVPLYMEVAIFARVARGSSILSCR